VKICGVTTPAAIEACIEADVDWVGFVFFERSPRAITGPAAARLAARLPATIATVGLFVEPDDPSIEAVLAAVPLTALQLYAPDDRVDEIRRRFGLPAWHAKPVATAVELPSRTNADRLVIEAKSLGSDRPGGNAARLDWTMLRGWNPPAPWLLAGGLTPANVGDAIAVSGAPAVDVSSGVEDGPGSKDPRAILAFTRTARSAQ
jgi:phosphoribosylanthranilate isomerase